MSSKQRLRNCQEQIFKFKKKQEFLLLCSLQYFLFLDLGDPVLKILLFVIPFLGDCPDSLNSYP